MKNAFIAMFLSLSFLGCLEFDILVKVNPDGSGTVEQTVLMNKTLIHEMKEMTQSFGGQDGTKGNGFNLIDKKKLSEEAQAMGKGVRFSHVSEISNADQEGYTAYYTFDDIAALSINQSPTGKTPISQKSDESTQKEPLIFTFTKGIPATLIIHQTEHAIKPDINKEETEESQPEMNDTSDIEMLMSMIKGFRLSMVLQVNGTILKTNATNVDANRVTLMEIDFQQLIRDRHKFLAISKHKPQTIEEAKQVLKDIPGIKFEMAKETTIQFQ